MHWGYLAGHPESHRNFKPKPASQTNCSGVILSIRSTTAQPQEPLTVRRQWRLPGLSIPALLGG